MSFIDNLKTVGGGFAKTLGGASNPWTAAGMFLGNLTNTLISDRRQLRQNERLMQQQADVNKSLIDYKSPAYDVARLKEAGLNPALYYGGGGSGGQGISGVSQGNTANYAEVMSAKSQIALASKQLELMESEKQVNLAEAEKLKAGASKDIAESQTTNETREAIKTKLGAEALNSRIQNYKSHWELSGETARDLGGEDAINTYDPTGKIVQINELGYYFRKADNEITAGLMEIANKEQNTALAKATETLTNKKAQYYYTELLNEIKKGDADMIRARAMKLANEFSTGEFINWKTYIELGFKGAELIFDGVGAFTKVGVLKNLQLKTLQGGNK